jgi:hypothetical protein
MHSSAWAVSEMLWLSEQEQDSAEDTSCRIDSVNSWILRILGCWSLRISWTEWMHEEMKQSGRNLRGTRGDLEL